jgi:hypothetical protein
MKSVFDVCFVFFIYVIRSWLISSPHDNVKVLDAFISVNKQLVALGEKDRYNVITNIWDQNSQ